MAGEQSDINNELKDVAERLDRIGRQAAEKDLAGAKSLEQAKQQAGENSQAGQATQKAAEALQAAKADDAQRETARATKALDQLARALQDAAAKTTAGDLKALAQAIRKTQELAKEQSDINRDIAAKRDSSPLGQREDRVAAAAKELGEAAEKLESLRQQGRQGPAKEKLDEASKQAAATAQALQRNDTAAAKAPGEQAEKALNQAINEMERAAGKTLEEKARDAKKVAAAARENQEKASAATKEIQAPAADQKLDAASAAKRDEAAAKEHQAAREATRLDHALKGLDEMARDANPAAADAAREARETTEKAELPKAMEQLAQQVAEIGKPQPANSKRVRPYEAAKKGDELAQTVRKVEKDLDTFIAEATNSQLDRLRAMETAARDAAKKAQELTRTQTNADEHGPKQAELKTDLKRLEPKLQRLEANAPELAKMREALGELQKDGQVQREKTDAQGQPMPSPRNTGGPNFKRVAENLDDVAGGLLTRVERILRAREVKPDEDEDAPKEYRPLVDRYYRALSEDVEEEKK
jgi:hypothetical protein